MMRPPAPTRRRGTGKFRPVSQPTSSTTLPSMSPSGLIVCSRNLLQAVEKPLRPAKQRRRGMSDMRRQPDLFLYGTLEERIPKDHLLRPIRALADTALAELSERFDRLYAEQGRPSIGPEKLLRALLSQAL